MSGFDIATGIVRTATWLGETLASVLLAVVALITGYEVAARYFFNAPTIWSQDLAIYMLLWLAFLGMAAAERSDQHIRIDLLYKHFAPAVQRWVEIAVFLLVAGFAIVAVWSGTEMVLQSVRLGRMSVSLFSVPIWIPQLALPIGMALLALECLHRVARTLLRKPEPPP